MPEIHDAASIIHKNNVQVDEAIFHPKSPDRSLGKGKDHAFVVGEVSNAAEASFTRGRIAGQSHGKGSFANFEGDGLLGHGRSATGQKSEQTPQREDQSQRISLLRVGGHVRGCLWVMGS